MALLRSRLVVLSVALPVVLLGLAAPSTSAVATADDDRGLYLVTLNGPGTSSSVLPGDVLSLWMTSAQDQVLAAVGAGDPTYRWTTALSGVAVELTETQADRVATDPRVALVEPDRVLHLAGQPSLPTASSTASPVAPETGRGAGTVIGFVDSGITPEGPLFAGTPALGATPSGYRGECRTAPDWPADACTPKLVGAQWFVDGFGVDRLREASSLSARDDDGHGTAVASVAAGNDDLTARVRGQRLGAFAGVAPDARVAAYKACWTAPDPADDGCSAADVVSAIDRATADRVDVLNISVAADAVPDPAEDTVQRALLGAAEADIVVVGAAGQGAGDVGYAAPWVTTVGAVTGDVRRGDVVLADGRRLPGVMVSDRSVGPAPLVAGGDVPAVGRSRDDARLCLPGSLDAGRVAGHVVLCARGEVGRIDKSQAVRHADGVGMVLANQVDGSVDPDLHAVPTVHVDAADGRDLRRWLGRHPRGTVTLRPHGVHRSDPRLAAWSRTGDVRTGVVTPDVLAVGSGVLAAGLPDPGGSRWQLLSGTSVAAAQVSGAAAVLRGRRPWTAVLVRSALAGTAELVRGSPNGAGLVRPGAATDATLGVSVEPSDYRAWLGGRRTELGAAALILGPDRRTVTRTVTNLSGRTGTFTPRVVGLGQLRVSPVGLRLTPGESAAVTLRVVGAVRGRDRGTVLWDVPGAAPTRWAVVLER